MEVFLQVYYKFGWFGVILLAAWSIYLFIASAFGIRAAAETKEYYPGDGTLVSKIFVAYLYFLAIIYIGNRHPWSLAEMVEGAPSASLSRLRNSLARSRRSAAVSCSPVRCPYRPFPRPTAAVSVPVE